MQRAIVLAGFVALVLPTAAAVEGMTLKTPALGTTVSSTAPVEFTWDNPNYHPLGEDQVMYVATDPAFTNIVYQHGDHCEPMMLCPQGVTAGPFQPGTYYWKVRLYAWDWNPESDVWWFTSAAPPPPHRPRLHRHRLHHHHLCRRRRAAAFRALSGSCWHVQRHSSAGGTARWGAFATRGPRASAKGG
jgi:hypothetical protein